MAGMAEKYMQRCIALALKGAGDVAPNPMVGAVLVYEDRIIGEGYHQKYGQPHAEVNCLAAVSPEDRKLIGQSVLYVSLEPCAHYGKTPPCADLIIAHKIPTVVIGCRDSYKEVDGEGMLRLQRAGIKVTTGVLEKECRELNKRFFCFHEKRRPYVILKWAQTKDGKIAGKDGADRLLISNEYTNREVHRWRSEEAAILVGTHTAMKDNPSLTTRLWKGASPVRLVLDRRLQLTASCHLLDGSVKTIVFNQERHDLEGSVMYYKTDPATSFVQQCIEALYALRLQSVIVEGGAKLLQSFIDEGIWDEMRIITNQVLTIGAGLVAPLLPQHRITKEWKIQDDLIQICEPVN